MPPHISLNREAYRFQLHSFTYTNTGTEKSVRTERHRETQTYTGILRDTHRNTQMHVYIQAKIEMQAK